MLITLDNRQEYQGNSTTTTFTTRYVEQADELVVYLIDNTTKVATKQTYLSDYTLDDVGDTEGAKVQFLTAPATGNTVLIIRIPVQTQDTDFSAVATPAAITLMGDKLTTLVQRVADRLNRTLRLKDTVLEADAPDLTIPDFEGKDGQTLRLNNAGTALEWVALDSFGATIDAATTAFDPLGTTLTSTDMQAAAVELSERISSLGVFKNKFVNGALDFWQRGTSSGAVGFHTADRVYHAVSGITATLARAAWSAGTIIDSFAPAYYANVNRSTLGSAAGDYCREQVKFESLRRFSGKTWTLSFWCNASVATDIAAELTYNYGTGGSPSAEELGVHVKKASLTAAHSRVSITFTVPDLSAKSWGANNNDYLGFNLWLSAGSDFDTRTDTLGHQPIAINNFWMLQLEEGDTATQFDYHDKATEFKRCARYYFSTYDDGVAPGSVSLPGAITVVSVASTSGYGFDRRLVSQMRATPTVTWYSPSTGTVNRIRNASTAADIVVSSSGYQSVHSNGIPTLSAAPLAAQLLTGHCECDAEL